MSAHKYIRMQRSTPNASRGMRSNGGLRVTEAIAFVQSHWRTIQTMGSVAATFRVDASNLTRCFRHKVGSTPKRYLNDRRKLFVIEQLQNNAPLGYQIGTELGFSNDISFYRWVRRAFGLSYRELSAEVRKGSWGKSLSDQRDRVLR